MDRRAVLCAKLFLAVCLPAALALALIIGPLGVADEPAHFLRAAALAQGDVLPRIGTNDIVEKERRAAGAYLDSSAADFARSADFDRFHQRSHKASIAAIEQEMNRVPGSPARFVAHSNTAIYPPFLYVTPVAAVAASRVLRAPPIVWLYTARLGNALVGCAIMAWAIGRARSAGPVLLLFAASPLCLFMIAGLTADALLLPLATVFAAEVSRIASPSLSSGKDAAVFGSAALILGVGKVAYMPLAALPPVAAYLADRGTSERFRILLALFVAAIGLWLLWAAAVQDAVFSMRPDVMVAPKQQMLFMLHNPATALNRLGTAFDKEWSLRVRELVGYRLGWSEFGMPAWFSDAYLASIVVVGLTASEPTRRSVPIAIMAAILVVLCAVAVLALIYCQYNAVGADRLLGFQGRYYTPLLMVLVSVAPCFVWRRGARLLSWAAMSIATFSTLYLLIRVIMRYWI